ncbi:MAG: NAD(P)H-hydrate dehydratase [Chthoniobacterales bacterium]
MDSPVVSVAEMRAAEDAAFAHGITAEALMDEAAEGIARAIQKFFPTPGRCVVFAGKGNNAGDALAAAALLQKSGWEIDLRTVFADEELGELPRKKLAQLKRQTFAGECLGQIVLDGLLGLGAKPPLREPIRAACQEINRLHREHAAYVFALDLPSGLDGDSGAADDDCVVADFTVAIGAAKQGLLADDALNFVGRLEVVSLGALTFTESPKAIVAEPSSLRTLLPRRSFGAFKNQFGRVGIVAGSKGFTGAALLCSLGALRGGAGLVELFVPEEIYPIVASAAAPEVMVKSVRSYDAVLDEPLDILALGPGLGRAHAEEILRVIEAAPITMVLDADGLNILSEKMDVLGRCAGPRLLTPHPGEMKRLFPDENGTRAERSRRFCEQYPVTLLLKGSRTIISETGRPQGYNTTGDPGMATGGMGDVLTGVCAALLAQKLSNYDAARLGAWVCGRAAELAIFYGDASEQSLLPTDLLTHLGRAFRDLQGDFA